MRKIRYPRVDEDLFNAVRQEAEPAQRQWPAAQHAAPPQHTPDTSREQQVLQVLQWHAAPTLALLLRGRLTMHCLCWQVMGVPRCITGAQAPQQMSAELPHGAAQGESAFTSPAQLMRYLRSGANEAAHQQYWERLRASYEVCTEIEATVPWPQLKPAIGCHCRLAATTSC